MKYGVKVFANGRELFSRFYTDIETAKEVANNNEKFGYRVYRTIIDEKTVKVVKNF